MRVTHQGATYFIGAPEGGAPGDIAVYDVAAKVDGVLIDEDVLGLETENGQLRVIERYIVRNTSTPPRTQWRQRSFEVVLPVEAVIEGISAQRPGGLPTTLKLDPDGPKGHYSFNFPIQPDNADKGTLFQIEYTVPYSSGKFTFHPQVSLPARTVWVVLPKSMTLASGADSAFQSSPQDPAVQTFVSRSAVPGKALEFTVSGSGSLPRDNQGASGQQADSGMGDSAAGELAPRAASRAAASATPSEHPTRLPSTSGGFWPPLPCCWQPPLPSCCASNRGRPRSALLKTSPGRSLPLRRLPAGTPHCSTCSKRNFSLWKARSSREPCPPESTLK